MSNDIPEMRIWLALPHEERQAAVIAAGKLPDGRNFVTWSKEDQLWYAHPGVDRERIKPWLPDRSLRNSGGDPQSEFFDAMTSAGLVLKGLPVMDGKRQRVATVEDKGGKKSGVYRGFLDGRPAGWFINYHRAETEKSVTNWKATGGEADPHVRLHIHAAMRQSQDDAARERAATYAAQTAKAKSLYEKLPAADPLHPYLVKKGITPTAELRQTRNGALVVPFNDVSGNFRTLQYIPPEGEKYLFTDAPKVGNFLVVGGELRDGDPIIYAEGYATARSLNLASGLPVVMTIDAGNMLNVAQQLKKHYPTSPHVFMADMDLKKDVNKGFLSATSAAELTEGAVLVPPFTADEVSSGFTDFNDLHHSRGLQGLRDYLESTLPKTLTSINPEKYPMKAPSDPALRTEQNTTEGMDSNKKPPARSGSAKEKAPQVHALVAQGVSNAEIAKQLDIGLSSVYRILKAPPAPADNVSNIDYETGEILAPADSDEQLPKTNAVGASFASAVSDISEATSSVGVSQGDVTPADLSKNDTAESINNSNDTLETSVPDLASQAHLMQQQGLSLAQIAASLDIGVSQAHRLLNESAAKDPILNSAQHETNDTAASSKIETPGVNEFADQFSDISTRMQALIDDSKNLETNEFQSKLLALMSERLSLTGVWMSADAYTFDSGIDTKCLALEDQLKTHLEEVLAAVHSNASSTSNPHEENAILTGPRRVSPSSEDIPEALKRIDIDKLLSRMTYEEHPDGKSVIYKLDGEAAFTDHGNRLVMAAGASDHEEKVLSALLTAAQHYHGRIELTGSDAFKSYAISLIVAHKLDVTMKVATQQAALDAARREAGQPVAPSNTVAGNPDRSPEAQRNDSPTSGSQYRAAEPPKSEANPPNEPPAGEYKQSDPYVTASRASEANKASQQPEPERNHTKEAIHTPAEKAREGVTGKVIACGEAPFRFEKGESESTYITLRTKEGTQTYWGKELAGLLRETRVQPGKMITLQWQGKQPVTVQVPQKNKEGIITHYKPHETNRNQWSMTPLGGERVQTGSDEMVKLSAFDANRFTEVQRNLVTHLQITMPAPSAPADGLYWLRPDGQGSQNSGDALSASRPAHSDKAGDPVMSSWGEDGRPDLYLVQGDGDYLQGVVRREGEYQHVLVSLPDNKEAPPMVFNLITPDGAVPIGSGNGINRANGIPVPRENVVVRLQGDEQQRIVKLDAPQNMPPSMHARLGFDERWKAEAGFPKDRPVAAPQAVPVAPVSPQRPA